MNAGKAVYGILSGTTAVTDIVGTRIFPEIAEQEAVTPFIIYQLQSVAPEDTHDGPSKLDEVRFEFLCYADSYNEAADLGVAVRGALDRVSGTYNGVNVESVQFNDVDVEIEYDPRRYSQVLKFTFRIKRDDIEIALGTPVTGAELGDLSDVNVSGVTDNQILSYDAATDTWIPAADAGGAEQLNDLSDVNIVVPSEDEFLKYDGAEWINDALSISQVQGLQAALDATPDALDDLTDVKIVGTPADGDALVYSSGFWARGTAGASTLGDLSDVNLTTPSTGAYLQFDGAEWIDSVITLPSVPSTYYHNRYATEAGTLRSGATETVELYYTAQADGDGYAESASSDTATAGYDIRRKLYYAEKAQADPDTSGDWTQFADIADDTTFASAKATLLAYLKERTGGTVPISLKMTWEEVAEASLLLDTYTGAAAAYSLRQLESTATNAIRVRRASDNTEQDIGFSAGELDTTSLASFCSGTNGFVKTWYDQSGNANDATQTTAANQPKIYDSSTGVVTKNGKPSVSFDGASDHLQYTGNFLGGSAATSVSVSSFDNATRTSREIIFGAQDTSGARYDFLITRQASNAPTSAHVQNGIDLYVEGDSPGNSAAGTITDTNQHLFTAIYSNNVRRTVYNNGGALSTFTSYALGNLDDATAFLIGADIDAASNSIDGKIQEIVIWNSDQESLSNRTGIESNINTFYSIY